MTTGGDPYPADFGRCSGCCASRIGGYRLAAVDGPDTSGVVLNRTVLLEKLAAMHGWGPSARGFPAQCRGQANARAARVSRDPFLTRPRITLMIRRQPDTCAFRWRNLIRQTTG